MTPIRPYARLNVAICPYFVHNRGAGRAQSGGSVKKWVLAQAVWGISAGLFASALGVDAFWAGHPDLFSGALSVAGGAAFEPVPEAVVINPALAALVKRFSLDAGYTELAKTENEAGVGHAAQVGATFPTRWGVFSGGLHGGFLGGMQEPDLGNTLLARAGYARDVTGDLNIGALLWVGRNFGQGKWDFAVDFGFMYWLNTLGNWVQSRSGTALGLQEARWGMSFAHMSQTDEETGTAGLFPDAPTLKAGFASLFLSGRLLKAGFSVDVAVPSLKHLLLDAALQCCVKEALTFSVGWQLPALLPSVGVRLAFTVDTGGNPRLAGIGWAPHTGVAASTGWKQYGGTTAFGVGMTAHSGDAP